MPSYTKYHERSETVLFRSVAGILIIITCFAFGSGAFSMYTYAKDIQNFAPSWSFCLPAILDGGTLAASCTCLYLGLLGKNTFWPHCMVAFFFIASGFVQFAHAPEDGPGLLLLYSGVTITYAQIMALLPPTGLLIVFDLFIRVFKIRVKEQRQRLADDVATLSEQHHQLSNELMDRKEELAQLSKTIEENPTLQDVEPGIKGTNGHLSNPLDHTGANAEKQRQKELRQAEVLHLFNDEGCTTAREIHNLIGDKYGVTLRTINRDMKELRLQPSRDIDNDTDSITS